MLPVLEEARKAPSASICERLIIDKLDVTANGLEPSDGYIIVEVERYRDIEEFVSGSVQGVHWIARLVGNQKRSEGGWDAEYKVEELKP